MLNLKKLCSELLCTVTALALTGSIMPVLPLDSLASAQIVDSGINYTESVDYNLGSPDSGYTSCLWIRTEPGKNWTTNVTSYSLLLIGIGGYSSAVNSDGVDYAFDDAFFENLEGTLKNARSNGVTVGLRFRYDDNGATNPEPADFQTVLDHIAQIGESGLLYEYEDVISFVETGFVGSWGEQWGGKYTSLEHKAQVLDAFLNITPDTIPVLIRTPNTFRQWLSDYCGVTTTAADMSYSITDTELASKAQRVGLYNDGYMGSDSDLGTYSNRVGETAWLCTAPSYGGEFSGADEWRLKYTTWQPEYAVAEMYYTNLLRINSNIYRTRSVSSDFATQEEAQARLDEIDALYENCGLGDYDYGGTVTANDDGTFTAGWKWMGYDDFIYDEALDKKIGIGADNSAFYGQNMWQFIRAHLGYRFVLRSSELTSVSAPNESLELSFKVENTGFSETPKDKEVEVILSNGVIDYVYTTDINARDWSSGTVNSHSLDLTLPETIPGGEWSVYLRISELNDDPVYDSAFCTKFANVELQYDNRLGANFIGSFTVDAEADPQKTVYENQRPAGYYTDCPQFDVNETDTVTILDKNYTFTEDGHAGYTLLYKVEGITQPVQLGNWYTSFSCDTTGYGSAYTTYGLNTRNQELSEDGYYALHIPFFGCAFNCSSETSIAGVSKLTALNFNDSRNYWSEDTYTALNGSSGVTITPVAFIEGGYEGYSVTFHLADGDVTYSDTIYGFKDTIHQSINNKEAVTALSLLDKECPSQYSDENGNVYKLLGFTTKKDEKSFIIDKNFIAYGDIELYPFYELDMSLTDLNSNTAPLTNNTDNQSVRYTLDDSASTATVGDGSYWENNSGFSSTGSIIIPASVSDGNTSYTVTAIGDNAFGSNTAVTDVFIPDTVTYVGENAFCEGTTVYVYENGDAAGIIDTQRYNVVFIEKSSAKGDVNSDGNVNIADLAALRAWLVHLDVQINGSASDMNSDLVIDIFDLVMLRKKLAD